MKRQLQTNPSEYGQSLVVVVALVVVAHAGLAQTWHTVDDFQYTSGESAGNYGLCVAPNGTLFAAGYGLDSSGLVHGLVMASADSGQSWSGALDDYTYPGISATRYDGGMVADASGNLYVAGQALLNHSLASRWLVRRSTDNGLTWSTVDDFSLGGLRNTAQAITADAVGNIYVVGIASTSTTSYGAYEWVVRKGVNGTSWSTVDDFGPASGSQAIGVFVHPTAGVFVAGNSLVTVGKSSFQAWSVRRSLDGGATWSTVDTFQLGSTSYGRGFGTDAQGNLYAIGNAFETIKGKTRSHWIVRRSGNGAAGTWVTVDDFQPTSDGRAVPNGFAMDSLGDLFVVGVGATSNTFSNDWLVRRSLAGSGTWSTVDDFEYLSGADTQARVVACDNFGHVFVGGFGNDAAGISHWLIRKF